MRNWIAQVAIFMADPRLVVALPRVVLPRPTMSA
jgi:hypothetical protein